MKTHIFKKSILSFVIGMSALMAPCTIFAAVSSEGADECAKELLLSYFPEPIVTDTLKRFSIPQDKWAAIASTLSTKDKDVVKMVEEKAAAMNPNPLKDPQQRPAAVKLFRETLFQVFSDALKENGISDTTKFQVMLDDIQQQKAKKFAMCMEKQKNQAQSTASDKNSDDEDDITDDDQDDSDDDDQESEDNSKTNQKSK